MTAPRQAAAPGAPQRAASLLRDLGGCLALAGRAIAAVGALRGGPFRQRFLSLFLEAARKGAGDSGVRAAAIGTLLIVFMVKSLSANAGIAVKVLVIAVAREAGPLLAALIVLVRVGSVLAADISMMGLRGELRALGLLGLPVRDYMAVPALWALACATMVLTFYFQLTAVAGGIVVSALLLDLPMREMFEHLVMLLTPRDLLYTTFKSFMFGLIIATVNVHHGLEASDKAAGGLPETLSRSVMQSLFALLLWNATLAYLVYGVGAASATAAP